MRGVGWCAGFVGRSARAQGSQEFGLGGHGTEVLLWGFCFCFGVSVIHSGFGVQPVVYISTCLAQMGRRGVGASMFGDNDLGCCVCLKLAHLFSHFWW